MLLPLLLHMSSYQDRSAALASRYPPSDAYRHEEYPPTHAGYRSPPETRPPPGRYRDGVWDTADMYAAGPAPDYRMRRQPLTPQPHDHMYARPAPPHPDRDRDAYRSDWKAAPGRPLPPSRPSWSDGYDRRGSVPAYSGTYREYDMYDHDHARRPPPPPPAPRYAAYPDRRPPPPPAQRPMPRTLEEERRFATARQPPMYETAQRRLPPAVSATPYPSAMRPPAAPTEARPVSSIAAPSNDKKKRRIQLQCYIMYRPTRCLWGDCLAVLDCWSKLEKHIWHSHLAPSGPSSPSPHCKWEGCHYHADTVQDVYKHALVPHMKPFSARCPFNCLFEGSDFQALMDHIERRHAHNGPDDFVPGLIHHRPKLDEAKLPALPRKENNGRITFLGLSVKPHIGPISTRLSRMVSRKSLSGRHPRKEDFVKKKVAGAAISACLGGRRQSKAKDDIQEAIKEAIITTKRDVKLLEGPVVDGYSSPDTETTESQDSEGSIYEGRDVELESEEGGVITRGKLKRAASHSSLDADAKRPRTTEADGEADAEGEDVPIADPLPLVKTEITDQLAST